MHKVIVFTYGLLAESLVRTSRLILSSQPGIETYCVKLGCNLEEMKNGMEQSIRRSNTSDQEVLVLTDLMYGTSFNTMIQLEKECPFTHIAGTNLPLLIEAIDCRLMDGGSGSFGGLANAAGEGIVDSHILLQMNWYPRAAIQEGSKNV